MPSGYNYLFVNSAGAAAPVSSEYMKRSGLLDNYQKEKSKQAEQLELSYRKQYPQSNIPKSAFMGALETGNQPMIESKGKKYFLTEDTALGSRLNARAEESARRAGRVAQKFLPSYSYKTAEGEKYSGTFLGTGSYGGFGKNAVDANGNPLSKYSQNMMRRRANRGLNPYRAESTGKFQPSKTGFVDPRTNPSRSQRSGIDIFGNSTNQTMPQFPTNYDSNYWNGSYDQMNPSPFSPNTSPSPFSSIYGY